MQVPACFFSILHLWSMFSLEYWSITDWFYIHSILCTGVYGSFNYFCWKKDLMKYVFPWILINYRLNLYPFHIVYCSLKLFKLLLLKKQLMIYVVPWIFISYIIQSISIPYCALESTALLTILLKMDLIIYVSLGNWLITDRIYIHSILCTGL